MQAVLFTDLAEQLKLSERQLQDIVDDHLIRLKHYRNSKKHGGLIIYQKGAQIVLDYLNRPPPDPNVSDEVREVPILKLPKNIRLVLANIDGLVCRVIVKPKLRRLYQKGNLIKVRQIDGDLWTTII